MLRKSVTKGHFSTVKLVSLGFLGVIFIGSLLLWLPISNQKPITYVDALFTAASAICVTGLVTVVPATQFSGFGKVVLLILIQIGGLGVVACTTILLTMVSKKISLKERVVIKQAYNLENLSGMVSFIIRVIKITFIIQSLGVLFLLPQFIPIFGVPRGIWMSIYHSISAFCNADLNILGDANLLPFAASPLMNITVMSLVIMGGLGFTVWMDMIDNYKEISKGKTTWNHFLNRLSLQSKIVLTMTGTLIVGGAILFLALEFNNLGTLGEKGVFERIMAATFQSVTSRSGGFATIPQDNLTNASKMLSSVLMFIGGSPGSTAGGVKTTTVALVILTSLSVLRGKHSVECYGRRIAPMIVKTGITIFSLYFLTLFIGAMAITLLEPHLDFLDVWFETTSAIGTVGLSTGVTANLSRASHGVLMILMYLGRIGPVTAAMIFIGRAHRSEQARELPEKYIMIG